mgnify:FL=1
MSNPKLNIKEESSAKKTRSPPKKSKVEQSVPRKKKLKTDAEKTAEKEKIESEVAALTANLDDLKTQLKAKKAELKAATKELTKAENKKAAVEAKAAEEAKKGEAEDVLKKLLASGMTAEEILAKLQ